MSIYWSELINNPGHPVVTDMDKKTSDMNLSILIALGIYTLTSQAIRMISEMK